VGPRRDEGSQRHRCEAVGDCDQAGHEGCHFWWCRGFYSRQKGTQDGRSLLERLIDAPHCHHQQGRCGQSTSRCRILKDQSRGGPWGDAILSAPRWRPNA
jgi:hypothetical protein